MTLLLSPMWRNCRHFPSILLSFKSYMKNCNLASSVKYSEICQNFSNRDRVPTLPIVLRIGPQKPSPIHSTHIDKHKPATKLGTWFTHFRLQSPIGAQPAKTLQPKAVANSSSYEWSLGVGTGEVKLYYIVYLLILIQWKQILFCVFLRMAQSPLIFCRCGQQNLSYFCICTWSAEICHFLKMQKNAKSHHPKACVEADITDCATSKRVGYPLQLLNHH